VGKGEYKIEETTQGQQSQKEPQEAVTPGELGLGTGFAYSYAFGNKSLPEKNENGKEFTIPQAFAYIRKWLRYQIPIWIKGYRDEFEAVDTNIAEYPKLMRARINEVKYDFGAALDNEAVEIANRHKRPQSFYLALVNHPYFRRLYENAVAKIIKGVAGPVRRPQRLAGPIEVIQETLGTIIGFVFPYLRYILAIIFILIGQSIYANFSVTVTGSLLPLAVIYIIIFFLSDTLSFGTANYSYLIMGNPEETSMLIPGFGIPIPFIAMAGGGEVVEEEEEEEEKKSRYTERYSPEGEFIGWARGEPLPSELKSTRREKIRKGAQKLKNRLGKTKKPPLRFIKLIFDPILAGILAALGTIIILSIFEVESIVSWGTLICILFYFLIYNSNGLSGVISINLVVYLVGYIFIGPYGGYMHKYITGMKQPMKIAWLAVKQGWHNIWLMMTDPTAWYAQQQQKNVHPEKAISYPKGVEITSIDLMPPSVPSDGSIPFRVYVQIQNQGDMKARDVYVSAECVKRCKATGEENMLVEDLMPYEGRVIKLGPYVPEGSERQYAKLKIKAAYLYSTNSSLLTEVMGEEEMQRRFVEGEEVFRGVAALGKPSPAMLSLNVGKQPLRAGTEAGVLVSVLNTRNNGQVVLDENTEIRLHIPSDLRSGPIDCSSNIGKSPIECKQGDNPDTQICHIKKKYAPQIVKPMQANTIFSFYCSFDVTTDVEKTKSRLITAELINYRYEAIEEKTIMITLPLGVIDEEGKKPEGTTEIILSSDHKEAVLQVGTAIYECWHNKNLGDEARGTKSKLCFRLNAANLTEEIREGEVDDYLDREYGDKAEMLTGIIDRSHWTIDAIKPGQEICVFYESHYGRRNVVKTKLCED
ncbi:MAG: hypothetical protein J7K31_01185, partial [Candidatus Aenigmarchaeota archaeon]|nr:hypothetical protein [Candidatus Aenigmarchaeota archaeon]